MRRSGKNRAVARQNYRIKSDRIKAAFGELRKYHPKRLAKPLELSWSNWGFGKESLDDSLARLKRAGLSYVELQGNHHADGMGYKADEVRECLEKYGMKVSGTCGMFSPENDLSSPEGNRRRAAQDYIAREIDFLAELGGTYLLVVPGAVGRPDSLDEEEFVRSAAALREMGGRFEESGILCAVEPIRSDEVSLVHTVAEAKEFLELVGHPAIHGINGDVFHIQAGESHMGEAILEAGDRLINLHLADSNRGALGTGMMDLDTIIMALYLIGHNRPGRFVTPEPLGPGSNPYLAMNGEADPVALDKLVSSSVEYFREREDFVRNSALTG